MLFVLMCFFAQLGMLMFGGALYPGNPALTNSSFHELGYYPSNFNDFASSLVVLFVRLPQPPPCHRLFLLALSCADALAALACCCVCSYASMFWVAGDRICWW